jgi:hypothetical protein
MRGLVATTAAAALLAGCGGGNSKQANTSATSPPPPAATASSISCMMKAPDAPKRYSSRNDPGIENGVRPLFTEGAKGAEILIGRLGGVVIEYPSTIAAARAESDGRHSRVLTSYVAPKRITAIEKTLFIDYAHDPSVRRTVTACARHPERPPPPPK